MTQPRINENQIQKILSGKVIIEDFSNDKNYQKSVLVKYNGDIYLSLFEISIGEFDSSQWLRLADASNVDTKVETIEGIGNILVTRIENEVKITTQTFIFEQGVASSKWLINHNLNKYPSITVVDSSGNEIICDVQYNDLNNCVLEMNASFKGKAYLN